MQQTAAAPSPVSMRPRRSLPPWVARSLVFVGILGVLVLLWEGYKALGELTDGAIPFTNIDLPVRHDDTSMPHVHDIIDSLFSPVNRARDAEILLVILLKNAWFTAREAGLGFIFGSAAGFGLGALFSRSRLLERGLMPFVVASQTIPLIAIAPMVVIWGGQTGWSPIVSVAIISAYLAFFPVTINALRGLRSPQPSQIELMRSYAASEGEILWKVRLPASLPYLFTALKIAATTSVIGAIVGELPAGLGDGLGRSLLNFSYYYISGPEKLFAAIIVSALLGLVFFGVVVLAEKIVMRGRHRPVDGKPNLMGATVDELG